MRKTTRIIDVRAGTEVEALLKTDIDVYEIVEQWTPYQEELIERFVQQGLDPAEDFQHKEWNWTAKLDQAATL